MEVKVQTLLQENESVEKIYENLKKEALLPREDHVPVFYSTDSEQDIGDEISKIRAKFEKKRTLIDVVSTRCPEHANQHATASVVKCLRGTDRAVASLSTCFEK